MFVGHFRHLPSSKLTVTLPWKFLIFPGKYHQYGRFSMNMLVYWSGQYKKYTFSVVKFDRYNFPSSFPFWITLDVAMNHFPRILTSKGNARRSGPNRCFGEVGRIRGSKTPAKTNGYIKILKILSMEKKLHLESITDSRGSSFHRIFGSKFAKAFILLHHIRRTVRKHHNKIGMQKYQTGLFNFVYQ